MVPQRPEGGRKNSKTTHGRNSLRVEPEYAENPEAQHENAEDQHRTGKKPMDPDELIRFKLCNMMAYYQDSEKVRPKIQEELRRKIHIMNTEAGNVLAKKYNLPRPVDDESSNIPSSPGSVLTTTDHTSDDGSSTLSPPSLPPETMGQIDNLNNSTPHPSDPPGATTEQTGNNDSSTLSSVNPHSHPSHTPETTGQIDIESNSTLYLPNP
ncbi:hypothetical protein BDD12DRAFT_296855 [Trichophaea hybrida]|nr:hypothetical protein BDD12DRAFT_296855 [Trichophaea hybrida]